MNSVLRQPKGLGVAIKAFACRGADRTGRQKSRRAIKKSDSFSVRSYGVARVAFFQRHPEKPSYERAELRDCNYFSPMMISELIFLMLSGVVAAALVIVHVV
ncbi:hypothetical protein [Methylobacterium nigriterrae]|uniref:hypothetical protein n=1 Tax=Methylobacterium nigriterrae TaxID=3127512 RepID=UPI00301326A9